MTPTVLTNPSPVSEAAPDHRDSGSPRVLHLLNLDTIGGVEQLFHHSVCNLLPHEQRKIALLVTGKKIHPLFAPTFNDCLSSIDYAKLWRGIKVPKIPRAVRQAFQSSIIRHRQPDIAVFWNRLGDLELLRALHRDRAKAIYYEHGAAWLGRQSEGNRQFLREIDSVICNSHAAKRVVQLRWEYEGEIKVVSNPLRPDLYSEDQAPKTFPRDRPVRLGIAARLIPLKGVGVALHALRTLLSQHPGGFELHIAGHGPLRSFLEQQAVELGVADATSFKDCVADMRGFYRSIDVLLLPSVREPFGLVSVEAAAHGNPVIASQVDGVPETLRDGETGRCLSPTLDLSSCRLFGGEPSDFPSHVYDSGQDRLVEPRFLDPEKLAEAVMDTVGDPRQYQRLSANSVRHARENYSFEKYLDQLQAAITGDGRAKPSP